MVINETLRYIRKILDASIAMNFGKHGLQMPLPHGAYLYDLIIFVIWIIFRS